MKRLLEALWLLLIGTWCLIATTWVFLPTSGSLYVALIMLTTLLCCFAMLGHKQSRMHGGEVTLSIEEVLSSTGKLPKVALAATTVLAVILIVIDWRTGPARPDGLKLDELAAHPHGVRAMLGFLAFFQALGVAIASSAIKVRDAWMDL